MPNVAADRGMEIADSDRIVGEVGPQPASAICGRPEPLRTLALSPAGPQYRYRPTEPPLRLSNVEAFCRVHRLNLPQPAIARSGAYLAISSACETVRCMSAKTGL